MKTMNNRISSIVLAVVLMVAAAPALGAPIMIANNDVPEDALGAGQVKNLFLGKTAQWSTGSRVVLSMLKGGDVSAEFLKSNVKKSQKQFSTFWKKAVFSGTGEMPASFDTEADMVMFVSRTAGAIGYIDDATPHDDVKVISIK